jgi:hypothetical protein
MTLPNEEDTRKPLRRPISNLWAWFAEADDQSALPKLPEMCATGFAPSFWKRRGYDFKSELVQRLCGVERTVCQLVLDWLEDARFLSVKAGGAYARLSDGVPSNYSIDSSRRAFRSLLR